MPWTHSYSKSNFKKQFSITFPTEVIEREMEYVRITRYARKL